MTFEPCSSNPRHSNQPIYRADSYISERLISNKQEPEEVSLIEAEGLCKAYGQTRALDDVSLSIEGGEIYGLFGPNGAGKTTLVRVLSGVTRPDSGNAVVCGINAIREPIRVRENVHIMLELPYLYERMTVWNYLRFYARMSDVPERDLNKRVVEVLELVDMDMGHGSRVRRLSIGQRQRIEIARVMLGDAKVLFLDEPFLGVDLILRRNLRKYLRSWLNEERSILFISHELLESETIVDKYAFIHNGRIIAKGSSSELKEKYLIRTFHMEVSDRGRALRVISSLDGVQAARIDGEGLSVSLKGTGKISEVAKALVSEGIDLYEMRRVGTMEDVFSEVVSR